jgi:predicted metalloprotease
VQHVESDGSEYFEIRGDALDQALAGFLEIADSPGSSARDPNAHGSAFDRINAFQDGYEQGASSCAVYSDESLRLVQVPFETAEDAARGGDSPYDEILALATSDLEDYWSTVSDQVFETTWTPLERPVAFDPDRGGPDCGGETVQDLYLFYCVPDRYVGYDDVGLFPAVYEGGDFAVATLFGTQYALAAQDQLGIAPENALEQNLLADCMTGAWAASVFLKERPKDTNMVLSPGDLDEAVGVLLAFGDGSAESTQGTGFARVASYRKGVLGGVKACTDT